ncbi:MAG: chorismate pyruvate-lyase family protein [Candidatus Hydrothermarchaeota archaeon]|nr:chorismate pyruvate-lyase family protein [Candidatus Hydrothermarchaeota archaeon]
MKEIALSPVQKILLTTDGSITRILKALRGEEIKVETEKQEVIKADRKIARLLKINEGDEVNYRVVNLKDSNGVLIHAISYAPLRRLKKEFREDIMRRDVPIGRILAKLKIEARREIRNFGSMKADRKLSKLFGIPINALLLKRNYNIIHRNKILLNITEVFPYEFFR